MRRAAILTAGVAAAVLGVGCGGTSDAPDASRTARAARQNAFIITKVPEARTGRRAYREARSQCRAGGRQWRGAGMTEREIATSISSGYERRLRWFARVGCRDGLTGRRRDVDGW